MSPGNALLVTAHPDDEVMFFGPTIQRLLLQGAAVHVLCLSTGNADGLGNVRKMELLHACEALQIQVQQVAVKDHPALQDGMATQWDEAVIADLIEQQRQATAADMVVSFDGYGVSGHTNHRAVHRGLLQLLQRCSAKGQQEPPWEAWLLVSTSLVRKFAGCLDILPSLWEAAAAPESTMCFLTTSPLRIALAMAKHRSQWVWYRKLFVVLSRYTYVNTLRQIG